MLVFTTVPVFVLSVVFMTMMVAMNIRVVIETAGKQRLYRFVGAAGHTAIEFDPGLCQCLLCACTDTAADQRVHLQAGQKSCQSTVTAAVGVHNLLSGDLSIVHVIDFHLLCVSKMLEHKPTLVSNCNSHNGFSFLTY